MPAKNHRRGFHFLGRLRGYGRHNQTAISPTTYQRDTWPFSSLRVKCVAVSSRSESYFFRLIEFLNVVLCCWFQLQLSIRLYETKESFHRRQGTLSADGVFFSFRFRSM